MMQLTRITIWLLLTVLAPLGVLPAGTSICVCPPSVCGCDDGDGPARRADDDGETEVVTPSCCCCRESAEETGRERPLAEAPPAPRRPCHRLAVGERPSAVTETVVSFDRPDHPALRPVPEAFRPAVETPDVRRAASRWRHLASNPWPPTRPLPLLV
ncbi:MAG: hypothetical protein R3F20_08585 [Planctomycetota bacterium]